MSVDTQTPAEPEAPASPTHRRKFGFKRKPSTPPASSMMIGVGKGIPYFFSAPAIFTIGTVLAFPVVYAFYRSLFRISPFDQDRPFIGLDNYRELFSDPAFYATLTRTAVFVSGTVLLGVTLAVIFAFALNRLVGGMRWVRAFIIFPYIVSGVAVAVMFRLLFNTDYGLPNQALALMGIPGISWLGTNTWAMVVVIIAQVWSDLPLAILLIFGGLQTLDSSLLDAGAVDGASGWSRARYISLPLIAPQLVLATVFLSYRSLTTLGTILALTGGGPGTATETLTLEMLRVGFTEFNTGKGLAIVVVIFLINAVLSLFYLRLQRRGGQE